MNNKFLSIKGLETLLGKLKEKFVVKNELSDVATSGSYNDLTDKPTIPSEVEIPIATTNEAGIVKPSNGLSVDESGNLTVNVGDGLNLDNSNSLSINVGGSGFEINSGQLSLSFGCGMVDYGGKWNSVLFIQKSTWGEIYNEINDLLTSSEPNGLLYGITLILVKDNYNINIKLTKDIIDHFDEIYTYVSDSLSYDDNFKIEGCCDNEEEFYYYEFFKLLSDETDSVGLYLYQDLYGSSESNQNIVAKVGKNIPDVVTVFECGKIERFNNMDQPNFFTIDNVNIIRPTTYKYDINNNIYKKL